MHCLISKFLSFFVLRPSCIEYSLCQFGYFLLAHVYFWGKLLHTSSQLLGLLSQTLAFLFFFLGSFHFMSAFLNFCLEILAMALITLNLQFALIVDLCLLIEVPLHQPSLLVQLHPLLPQLMLLPL